MVLFSRRRGITIGREEGLIRQFNGAIVASDPVRSTRAQMRKVKNSNADKRKERAKRILKKIHAKDVSAFEVTFFDRIES